MYAALACLQERKRTKGIEERGRWVQVIVWMAVALLSVLIVASRKHYTVDVVVAWYTVPLVFFALHRRWTTKRIPTDWPHRAAEPPAELQEVVTHGGGPGGGSAGTAALKNGLLIKGWRAEPLDRKPGMKPPLANGLMNGFSHSPHDTEAPDAPAYENSFSSGSGGEGGGSSSSSHRLKSGSVARSRSSQLTGISENEKVEEERGTGTGPRRGPYGQSPIREHGPVGPEAGPPQRGPSSGSNISLSPADPRMGCSLS
eukprot:jgi/Botrbrau1/10694/Bobra.139_2s0024.2